MSGAFSKSMKRRFGRYGPSSADPVELMDDPAAKQAQRGADFIPGLLSSAAVATSTTGTTLSAVALAISITVMVVTITVSSRAFINSNQPVDFSPIYAGFSDLPIDSILRAGGNATSPSIKGSARSVLTENGTLVTPTGYFDRLYINGTAISNLNGSVGMGGTVIGPPTSQAQSLARWASTDGINALDSPVLLNDDGDISNARNVDITGSFNVNGRARGDVFTGVTPSSENPGKLLTSDATGTLISLSPVSTTDAGVLLAAGLNVSDGVYANDVFTTRIWVNGSLLSATALPENGNFTQIGVGQTYTQDLFVNGVKFQPYVLPVTANFSQLGIGSTYTAELYVNGVKYQAYSLPASVNFTSLGVSTAYANDVRVDRLWINGSLFTPTALSGSGNFSQVNATSASLGELYVAGVKFQPYVLPSTVNFTQLGVDSSYAKDVFTQRLWVNGTLYAPYTLPANVNFTQVQASAAYLDALFVAGQQYQPYVLPSVVNFTQIGVSAAYLDTLFVAGQQYQPYVLPQTVNFTQVGVADTYTNNLFVNGTKYVPYTLPSIVNFTQVGTGITYTDVLFVGGVQLNPGAIPADVSFTRVNTSILNVGGLPVDPLNLVKVTAPLPVSSGAVPVFITPTTISDSGVRINGTGAVSGISSLAANTVLLNGTDVTSVFVLPPNGTTQAGTLGVAVQDGQGKWHLEKSNASVSATGTLSVGGVDSSGPVSVAGVTRGDLFAPESTALDGHVLVSDGDNTRRTRSSTVEISPNGTVSGISVLSALQIFVGGIDIVNFVANATAPNSTVFGNVFGPAGFVDTDGVVVFATSMGRNIKSAPIHMYANGTIDAVTALVFDPLASSALISATNVNGLSLQGGSAGPQLTLLGTQVRLASGVSLTTAAGNLTLNPAGPSVDFSSKNAINLASISATSLSAGAITASGALTAGSVTTGLLTTTAGNLSVNPAGSAIDFNNKGLLAALYIQTPTITTSSGDLTLNPTGSNVNLSSKNLTNVDSGSFSRLSTTALNVTSITGAGSLTITGLTEVVVPNNGDDIVFTQAGIPRLLINSAGITLKNGYGLTVDDSIFSVFVTGGTVAWNGAALTAIASISAGSVTATTVLTNTVRTSSGDLVLNPTGSNVNLSGKTVTNVTNINTATAVVSSSLTTPTILTNSGNLVLNPAGTSIDVSSKNVINIANLAAATLAISTSISVPTVTTPSGNLVLNPAGASIDASAKNVINVANLAAATVVASTSVTAPTILTASGNLVLNPAGASIDASSKNLINLASLSATSATLTSSLSVPSITTASGNLALNPSGASVDVSNKNLVNVNAAVVDTLNATSGMNIGNSTGYFTNSPPSLFFGNAVSNVAGGGLKIKLYDDGTGTLAGFGVSATPLVSMDYVASPSVLAHTFYVGGAEKIRVATNGLFLSQPLSSLSGNLVLTTVGGNLTLSPAGSTIDMSSKNVIGMAGLNMGSTASAVGSPKLIVWTDGNIKYGLGNQAGVFSYETPNAPDAHVFYSAQTERMRINNAGLRLASGHPITTASGDLTLTPAGTNIALSSKVVTGIGALSLPYNCHTPASISQAATSGTFVMSCTSASGSSTIPAGTMNRAGAVFRITAIATISTTNGAGSSTALQFLFGTEVISMFTVPGVSVSGLVVRIVLECHVTSTNTLKCYSTVVSSDATYTRPTILTTSAAVAFGSAVATSVQVVQTGTQTFTVAFSTVMMERL